MHGFSEGPQTASENAGARVAVHWWRLARRPECFRALCTPPGKHGPAVQDMGQTNKCRLQNTWWLLQHPPPTGQLPPVLQPVRQAHCALLSGLMTGPHVWGGLVLGS